ncbi:uncharacterized protein LOC132301611 [Cornus florida]|uniref:uncharacterized protein LOC132301611 n=1 Tax=Cornus florida TaxID=4283 RepID=UPI002898A6AA|nr:uncharacterized protein LOC132301611 [Cornus florida]
MTNPSFRVYYGVSGAVPFMWESQPGTPKHTSCDTSLPPLTPPPSYYFNNINTNSTKSSRSEFLNALWLRINRKKARVTVSHASPSLSSSSSWSSRSSAMSVPMRHSKVHGQSQLSGARSSTLFPVFIVKKALLSVVSCRSNLCREANWVVW